MKRNIVFGGKVSDGTVLVYNLNSFNRVKIVIHVFNN